MQSGVQNGSHEMGTPVACLAHRIGLDYLLADHTIRKIVRLASRTIAHPCIGHAMASSTACAPSLSGCSLGCHSSEIRTGCANQRPSGSVRGATRNDCPYRARNRALSCADVLPGTATENMESLEALAENKSLSCEQKFQHAFSFVTQERLLTCQRASLKVSPPGPARNGLNGFASVNSGAPAADPADISGPSVRD
jgi:hypothetical protein